MSSTTTPTPMPPIRPMSRGSRPVTGGVVGGVVEVVGGGVVVVGGVVTGTPPAANGPYTALSVSVIGPYEAGGSRAVPSGSPSTIIERSTLYVMTL